MAEGALQQAFFDRWAARHPEEASTLGIHAGVLSDPSLEAIEDEARELRAMLSELEGAAIDPLDRAAIEGWARHTSRLVGAGAHLANVELGLEPYHLLRHFLVHARTAEHEALASARIAAMPRFLAAHERTLAIGTERGARAHAGTIEWIAGTTETIARALAALGDRLDRSACDAAAAAYAGHGAFLRERVLRRARASGAIGAGEVVLRLGDMGISRSPRELVEEARGALEHAHREMIACAARVLGGTHDASSVRAEIAARVARPIALTPQRSTPMAAYAELVERATAFARAHDLVPIEGPLAVEVAEMPPAIAEAGHAQNWAAPLRASESAPEPRAHFLVAADPAAHPAIAAPLLAVHEGVPGHSLQSLAFARAHRRSPAPVRFLAIADDVAMARGYFGAMLSIEGWASWVEHRMLELGFYEGEQELYAWSVRALRAARVIADLELHTGSLEPDACAAMLVREACLPEATARREVARYQRIPLQALTYLTGALAIERALGRGVSIAELLAAGPVPPDLLAASAARRGSP